MKIFTIYSLLIVIFLTSCGGDLGSGRGKPQKERSQPGLNPNDSILINSQIHRTRGFEIISYLRETELSISGTLPSGYRTIPNQLTDDEGTDGLNIITISALGRPSIPCGVDESFKGIDSRVNDCASKNKTNSNWNGYQHGSSGEGSWSLVALTQTGKEIWLDQRTGMVWSDIITSDNWCKASGNKQPSSPSNSVDCETLSEGTSLCVNSFTEGIGTDIRWRLPTRNDYLQADINGLRFILKLGSANGSWTSTIEAGSEGRSQAWAYHFSNGTLSSAELTSSKQVRCIGVAIR